MIHSSAGRRMTTMRRSTLRATMRRAPSSSPARAVTFAPESRSSSPSFGSFQSRFGYQADRTAAGSSAQRAKPDRGARSTGPAERRLPPCAYRTFFRSSLEGGRASLRARRVGGTRQTANHQRVIPLHRSSLRSSSVPLERGTDFLLGPPSRRSRPFGRGVGGRR